MSMQFMWPVVKALDATFQKRSLAMHCGEEGVTFFPNATGRYVLVMDTALSKKILISSCFKSFNYFQPGMAALMEKDMPVALLTDFYQHNILFQEGPSHHHIKKAFSVLLDEITSELKRMTPRLIRFFNKRSACIKSPYAFADLLTRITLGFSVARLTNRSLHTVYRALSVRQNVFTTYFQPSRHEAMAMVLNRLYSRMPPPEKTHPDWMRHFLAQHVIVMGVDPLMSGICANLVEAHQQSFTERLSRYCPTTFVVRTCVQSVLMNDVKFEEADMCYVALLPGPTQPSNQCPMHAPLRLPFGVGNHTCIGKKLSILIVEIAQKIGDDVFPNGFEKSAAVSQNGAFLGFKEVMESH